jgi:hypothetical protein
MLVIGLDVPQPHRLLDLMLAPGPRFGEDGQFKTAAEAGANLAKHPIVGGKGLEPLTLSV